MRCNDSYEAFEPGVASDYLNLVSEALLGICWGNLRTLVATISNQCPVDSNSRIGSVNDTLHSFSKPPILNRQDKRKKQQANYQKLLHIYSLSRSLMLLR
jgi:hypothetical protein